MTSATTAKSAKPPRRVVRRGPIDLEPVMAASSEARRQAAAILEVLAGVRRPSEAAVALGTSLPRYYLLERRALTGLVVACEPRSKGPRMDSARRVAALERENLRLRRECDRQHALVRAAERSLGLTMPAVKPLAKGKPGSADSGTKKQRRPRRPTIRALKVARMLQADQPEGTSNGVAPDGAELTDAGP
jgi:hypothetical protein